MAATEREECLGRPLAMGEARLEIVGEPKCMTLGVGGSELAAGIAGAGHQAAADGAGLDADPQRLEGSDADPDVPISNIGDQEVLPNRQPQGAAAEAL